MQHLTQEMSFTTHAGTNGNIPLRKHKGQDLVVIFFKYCKTITTFRFGTEHLIGTSYQQC